MTSFLVWSCASGDVTLAICDREVCLNSSACYSWAMFVASQDIIFNLAQIIRPWYVLLSEKISFAYAMLVSTQSPALPALSILDSNALCITSQSSLSFLL